MTLHLLWIDVWASCRFQKAGKFGYAVQEIFDMKLRFIKYALSYDLVMGKSNREGENSMVYTNQSAPKHMPW